MTEPTVNDNSGSVNGGETTEPHRFVIGEDEFLLDGQPFVIRCGEIHFARVPPEYWRHRLRMCKAMGLNTVCVYLFWNFHEWEQGVFDWSARADVGAFCRLAREEGLWVLLRPGPYSCAEWEMGGLPWWLVRHDKIELRSRDPLFLEPARRFLKEVGRVLGPHQVTRGGAILMVQVENEYGFFGNDPEYMGAIQQTLVEAGFEVPLFACNPPGGLENGHREDLFQVVNFGAGAGEEAFKALRALQPRGPLMNGEYYPAWFDMWGRRHRTGEPAPIVADLEYMLSNRHSFSIYMAHGGTSFGLWAGADRPFSPDTSSYDYDAPISEAGWVTPKFEAIRAVFAKYLQSGETLPEPPAANPVVEIPPFELTEAAQIFENLPDGQSDEHPRTMEFYGQSRGCILYRTTLPAGPAGVLEADAVHDFGWIFVDRVQVGIMDRRRRRYRVDIPERSQPVQLDILIEAMGRVNFGREVYDRKGLHAPVRVDFPDGADPTVLTDWSVFPLPLDPEHLDRLEYRPRALKGGPAFWRGKFEIASPGDSFLDLRDWGKGVVWVNGHCLGRFWNIGPTQTMYMPGPWLKSGLNDVIVLDLLGPREPILRGRKTPILDELRLELDFAGSNRASGDFSCEGLAPATEGSFTGDPEWQVARFSQARRGRYLCLEALSSVDGGSVASVAELDALDENGHSLSKSCWKVLWADSEDLGSGSGADNILDGQPSSSWRTVPSAPYPHRIVVDFGEELTVSGIRYLPRGGGLENSDRIGEYRVFLEVMPFGLTAPV